MTHYVCGVIVPKGEVDFAESYIDKVMEEYSEEYEVEPYIDETKEELEKGFEKWKKKFKNKLKNKVKLEDYEKEFVEVGILKELTLREWCKSWNGHKDSEFDIDGNHLSTSNQKAIYDWYSIGGRWDGLFYKKDYSNTPDEKLEDNIIPIKELIEKFGKAEGTTKEKILKSLSDEHKENPYLIYTLVADGKVHQSRKYGWFGTYSEKEGEEDWKKKYLKILDKHKEDFMVNLDCHI